VFLTVTALIFLFASIFFATVAYSLHNFHRSRLAQICRRRGNEDRFGVVLRDDEAALRSCKIAESVSLVLAVLIFAYDRYSGHAVSTSEMLVEALLGVLTGWALLNVIPWALSRVVAEQVLFLTWPFIHVWTVAMQPATRVANWFDTIIHRIAGRQDPVPEDLETLTEEIQSVVDEGEREGILETRDGRMIHRVMEFRLEDVRADMTPRTDIETIQVDQSLEEARQQLLETGHSRVPIVEGSPDDIVGILYARDLLEQIGESKQKTLREIVREATYIPESTTINALLERMKRNRFHMAIVLDEYGGVSGLVTLEDILEEIVGDIADEFDEEEEDLIEHRDPHTIVVDARMHMDELNDIYDLEFPEDRDFDTIGGLVFSELGRVPKQGERFHWNNIQITVLEATERKVIRLELFSSIPWPKHEEGAPPEADQNGNNGAHRLTTSQS